MTVPEKRVADLSPAGQAFSLALQKLQRHADDCHRLDRARRSLLQVGAGTPKLKELAAGEVSKAETAARVSSGHLKAAIASWDETIVKMIASARQEVIFRTAPPPAPPLEGYTFPSPPERRRYFAPAWHPMAWLDEVPPAFFRRLGSSVRDWFSK